MDEAIESHREATAVKERLRTAQRRVHWLLLLFRTTERHEVAIEDVAVPEGRFMRPRLGSLTDKQGGWAVVVEDELTPPKVMALFRSRDRRFRTRSRYQSTHELKTWTVYRLEAFPVLAAQWLWRICRTREEIARRAEEGDLVADEIPCLDDLLWLTEKLPLTCGECTWRTDEGKCAHGAGPRTGLGVQHHSPSCTLAEPTSAFETDAYELDNVEEDDSDASS